jgi:transposase-like protein
MYNPSTIIEPAPNSGVMEGARRATGITPSDALPEVAQIMTPDPEVPEKKPRRKFTAQYKLAILEKADKCTQPGQLGALLRKEGLYSSNLNTWRRQRDKGLLTAMSPKKRGRKKVEKNPLTREVAKLQRENERLKKKLKKAEIIIDFQKKVSEILGISQDQDEGNNS